jgi:hypothetical protein
VAVRAHDNVPGPDQSEFGQQRMLDADIAALVIVGDAHFPGKVADSLDLLGRIDVLVRGEVVADQGDPVAVEDVTAPMLRKDLMARGAVMSLARTRDTRHWTI